MEDISRGLNLKRSVMSEFELRSVDHESRAHARQSRAEAKLPALLTHALSSDTPCASASLCKIREFMANKCSYVRETMQALYQVVNLISHIATIIITVLCGCLFIMNQAMCVLKGIPFICSMPYNMYNAIFKMSIQLWEAVKTTTSVCQIHGHMLLSS